MDVLVDILLSLLGRAGDALPFAPLREACEALFRAFADQVTPQGFRDMVRVVQQAAAGQDDEEEDDDMFEEGAEAGDAAAGVLSVLPCTLQGHCLVHCELFPKAGNLQPPS